MLFNSLDVQYMSSVNIIIALIPSNFNLRDIEKINQIYYSKSKSDKTYMFLDSLTSPLREKTIAINPYTKLNAKKLKYLYGDCYKEIIDFLINGGVVESNNRYVVGKESKGYRFTEKYRNSIPMVCKIDNSTLVKKFNKINTSGPTIYPHLNKFTSDICIDIVSAEQFVFELYYFKMEEYMIDLDGYFELQSQFNYQDIDIPVNPVFWLYSQLRAIYSIFNNQFRFKVDETGYRLHTNLTNIKSELRNFITFNGAKLVSVDYSNSQPLLTTVLLRDDYWNEIKQEGSALHYTDIKYKDEELKFINDIIDSIKSSTYTMIPTLIKSNESRGTERYVSLCESGELYEYLQETLRLCNGSRKRVKVAVFQILFTDNRFIGQKAAQPKSEFKKLFPEVYRILSIIKKNKSNLLPILLQRIESEIILNRVSKRIERERPELPIFTIHDSVVTTRGNEYYIECVMKDEMEKAINLMPNTKIEYWEPKNISLESNLNDSVA